MVGLAPDHPRGQGVGAPAGSPGTRQSYGTQAAIDLHRTQTGNPTATFSERDQIRAHRDFFAEAGFDEAAGVSTGTKAPMLASSPTVHTVGWGAPARESGTPPTARPRTANFTRG